MRFNSSKAHCSDQSIGRSVRRLIQKPRGSRPSIAASALSQPIDLIDDDDVDPSGLHIDEQFLQSRPIHRAAGKAAIVITVPDQPPALVSLGLFEVGLGRLQDHDPLKPRHRLEVEVDVVPVPGED